MEVTITNSIVIYPSVLPFADDHILSLSHIDTDPNLNITIRYLRVYISNSTAATKSDPVQVISSALSQTLVHYYQFSGTLRRNSSDHHRLELHCAEGNGVPLISATCNASLESVNYLDDPHTHFVEQLVPDPNPEDGLINPFSLQITVFECGGYTLGASVHNSLCEGLGATLFFNAMAEFARGATRIKFEPVWDRAVLLGPRKPPRVEVPFHEILCLDKEFDHFGRIAEPIIKECFHVKDESLDRFKNELLEQSGLCFTTFEALGAYIWRAM